MVLFCSDRVVLLNSGEDSAKKTFSCCRFEPPTTYFQIRLTRPPTNWVRFDLTRGFLQSVAGLLVGNLMSSGWSRVGHKPDPDRSADTPNIYAFMWDLYLNYKRMGTFTPFCCSWELCAWIVPWVVPLVSPFPFHQVKMDEFFLSIPNFCLGLRPSWIPLTFAWIAFRFSTHRGPLYRLWTYFHFLFFFIFLFLSLTSSLLLSFPSPNMAIWEAPIASSSFRI